GHATESFLIALILAEVMPTAASLPNVDAPDNPPPPLAGISPLQQMAARIARNREVLGLHYPSDSKAGRQLAVRTLEILKKCKSIVDPTNASAGLLYDAKQEWL
ncbi:MAG: hypothetical protein ACREDP_19765, partial [Bradyrhizobium sp.]